MKKSLQNTNLEAYSDGSKIIFSQTPEFGGKTPATTDQLLTVVPTGTILDRPSGSSIPSGYLLRNNQFISKTTYSDLYAVMGDRFGATETTFCVGGVRKGFSPIQLTSLGPGTANWRGATKTPTNDIYLCVYNGDIYKKPYNSDTFVALSQASRAWNGLCATSNGDVYACVYNGDIYKQTAGSGDFVALSVGTANWRALLTTPDDDIYGCAYAGDIYLKLHNSETFNALSQTSRSYSSLGYDPANNDVYAGVFDGDIYIRYNQTGDFLALGQPTKRYTGFCTTSQGDLITCCYDTDLKIRPFNRGDFLTLGTQNQKWYGMTIDDDDQVYIGIYSGDAYKSSPVGFNQEIIKY